MAEEDLDKSDPASPYKLEKARERGSVAKSPEVTYVMVLFGMTCMVFALGQHVSRELMRLFHALLQRANHGVADITGTMELMEAASSELATLLLPPLLLLAVAVIGISIWQVGFVISAEPIKPDFNRINPATGFKRVFSLRTIYELVRSSIKLGVAGILVWVLGQEVLGDLMKLPNKTPHGVLGYVQQETGMLLAWMTALFLLLALIDLMFSRWEFMRQMRMSKREIKDEQKQREGDPRIKARIKELRLEWFKKGLALKRVKQADVLLTNPTHYAVALAYKRDSMSSPKVLCTGSGSMALRMRELAIKHQVPVVQNPPLARALYRETGIDSPLPEKYYAEVARLLVWVFAMRRLKQATSRQ